MQPIETIPTDELIDDLDASLKDIKVCGSALALGVTRHRDGSSVQRRIDVNRRIVEVIQAELIRRRKISDSSVDAIPTNR